MVDNHPDQEARNKLINHHFNLFVNNGSMMKASEKRVSKEKVGVETEKEVAKGNREDVVEQMEELRKILEEIKTDMGNEQEIIFNAVKEKTQSTRASDYSILDTIEGIKDIFLDYYKLYEKKIITNDQYYKLKDSLRKRTTSKGNPIIDFVFIIYRIRHLREFPSPSNKLPKRARSLRRPHPSIPLRRAYTVNLHIWILQSDSPNLFSHKIKSPG